jgi:hypothetical protein
MRIEVPKDLVKILDTHAKRNGLTRIEYLSWVLTGVEPKKK